MGTANWLSRLYRSLSRRRSKLVHSNLVEPAKRLYYGLRLAARDEEYRRAVVDAFVAHLPGAPGFKRLYYGLRLALRDAAYRRALTGLWFDCLPFAEELKRAYYVLGTAQRDPAYRRALVGLWLDRLPFMKRLKRGWYALRLALRDALYRRALAAIWFDRLPFAKELKRAYYVLCTAQKDRVYRRALITLWLDRLPLVKGLKQAHYVLRTARGDRAYRRALIGLWLERLPLGPDLRRAYYRLRYSWQRADSARHDRAFIRAYRFSSNQLRAFALVTDRLQLGVPADQVLAVLQSHLAAADFANLLVLLDYMARHSNDGDTDAPIRIRRPTDLGSGPERERRRNILFVSGQFPNPHHGGGGRVADFIKIMSRDSDVYLYAWYQPLEDAAAYEALRPYCKAIKVVPVTEFEGSLAAVKEFVGDTPMDVVHYEWPRSLTNYDPTLGKHHIFTYMEAVSLRLLMDMGLERPYSVRWVCKLIQLVNTLKVEVVDAAKVDLLVVVTQKDGEFLARFNPRASYAIVNTGTSLDEFCQLDQPPEDHTLVYTGNYVHYPNEDAVRFFFEEVFGRIREGIPDVKVYIVGANPGKRVRAYHDGRQIIVTGTVPDVRPYIQRASVCIAPLISGAGIRGKVTQYAALRRVCVATTTAATDLVYEDGKEILVADEPSVFARKVISLLQNPDMARRMGQAAYEKAVLHYDNRHLVQGLYRVYDALDAAWVARG